MSEYGSAYSGFGRFVKYAWGLVSAALLLAGFYEALYFAGGVVSGGLWVYVYYFRAKGNA